MRRSHSYILLFGSNRPCVWRIIGPFATLVSSTCMFTGTSSSQRVTLSSSMILSICNYNTSTTCSGRSQCGTYVDDACNNNGDGTWTRYTANDIEFSAAHMMMTLSSFVTLGVVVVPMMLANMVVSW